jgi:hypothetical protein
MESSMSLDHAMPLEQPFALPASLSTRLAAIHGHWKMLKRGNATIPFTDDFRPSLLGGLGENAALIACLEHPQQFCFTTAGKNVSRCYGGDLEGMFAGELSSRTPLHLFRSQCSATVDQAEPNFYRHPAEAGHGGYERMLLPMWGDGRVNAILAAFDCAGEIK